MFLQNTVSSSYYKPTQIKELKTMPCYKYKLMRPNIGIVSSNINEGIKAVLFFYEKISHAQKHKMHKTQINNFHSEVFTRI